MQRKIRVLVGKPGLDGHDRGAKVVAAALRDAGMEVVYSGLHQTPEQIVEAAIQEDVDVVALSILSGAHMTLFPAVQALLEQRGVGDKLLTGGGIIPPEDMDALAARGVGRLFGPGTRTQDIVAYIREWFAGRHGAEALAPLPPPAAPRELAYPSMPAPEPASRRAGRPAASSARAESARVRRAEARHHARPKRAAAPSGRARPKPARPQASTRAAGTRGKVSSKPAPRATSKARPRAKGRAVRRAARARK
jgi:methylmalonyl-CoA mutase C-terminal domain/subunit